MSVAIVSRARTISPFRNLPPSSWDEPALRLVYLPAWQIHRGIEPPAPCRIRPDDSRGDKGGGLRPRRGDSGLRARLGRGPRGAGARARRALARGRPTGHDGDELRRVVALHARRDRPE